jgi:hypothetical protein
LIRLVGATTSGAVRAWEGDSFAGSEGISGGLSLRLADRLVRNSRPILTAVQSDEWPCCWPGYAEHHHGMDMPARRAEPVGGATQLCLLPELRDSDDWVPDEHARKIGRLWVTRTKAALTAEVRNESPSHSRRATF